MKIILETIDSKDVKKYITEISKPNGHDRWGNTEWTSYPVVNVNGENEKIYSGEYIAHDGERAIGVGYIDHLPDRIAIYLDKSLEEKHKKERYERYLTLKQEFDVESEENTRIKREVNLKKLL